MKSDGQATKLVLKYAELSHIMLFWYTVCCNIKNFTHVTLSFSELSPGIVILMPEPGIFAILLNSINACPGKNKSTVEIYQLL
ncbi:MAG: hypothetical protein LUF35_03840, partial [Lachnospiraceae bacterium]|nr:hypothetical protein [Lachnospiraceae bacterium]